MTNDFLPYGLGVGSNVVTQGAYDGAGWRPTGFLPGLADASQANKVWRQSAFIISALAQFVSDKAGVDVLDDGDTAAFIASLQTALAIMERPARVIASSANFLISASDYAIGLNRPTIGLAATQGTLPAATIGQAFVVEDLAGNFDTANCGVTILPSAGTTFAGRANFQMTERRQSALFRFYGSNLWSVSTS